VEDAPGERRGGEVDSGWKEGLVDSSGEREEAVERGQEGVADDSSERQVRQVAVGAGRFFPCPCRPILLGIAQGLIKEGHEDHKKARVHQQHDPPDHDPDYGQGRWLLRLP